MTTITELNFPNCRKHAVSEEYKQHMQRQKELKSVIADYEQELYEKDRQIEQLQDNKLTLIELIQNILKNCKGEHEQ